MTIKNTNGKRITGKQVVGIIALMVGLFVAVLFVSFEVFQLDTMQNKAAAGWIITAELAAVTVAGVISVRRLRR